MKIVNDFWLTQYTVVQKVCSALEKYILIITLQGNTLVYKYNDNMKQS